MPMSKLDTENKRLVLIQLTRTGGWLVQDEDDHRGGHFKDQKGAMTYIRREFGDSCRLRFTQPAT